MKKDSSISPNGIAIISIYCLFFAIFFHAEQALIAVIPAVLTLLIFCGIFAKIYKMLLVLVLPFAIPAFIIHSFINPEFSISHDIGLNRFNFRADGAAYAFQISTLVLMIAITVTSWKPISRDCAFRFFLAQRYIPKPVTMAIMLSISFLLLATNRAHKILLAQKARGVKVDGNIFQRFKAIIAIAVPLIATTIIEIDIRSQWLAHRGIGSIQVSGNSPHPTIIDVFCALWMFGIFFFLLQKSL